MSCWPEATCAENIRRHDLRETLHPSAQRAASRSPGLSPAAHLVLAGNSRLLSIYLGPISITGTCKLKGAAMQSAHIRICIITVRISAKITFRCMSHSDAHACAFS